jgi:hypothetical protein
MLSSEGPPGPRAARGPAYRYDKELSYELGSFDRCAAAEAATFFNDDADSSYLKTLLRVIGEF